MTEKTKGLIRHLLTLIGGILITLGVVTTEAVDILITAVLEVIGGLSTIIGFYLSWRAKGKESDVQP